MLTIQPYNFTFNTAYTWNPHNNHSLESKLYPGMCKAYE